MLIALRKLIAFVFLCGILWFVYRDLGNVIDPSFRLSVAILFAVFAVIWIAVPPLVVYFRARDRRARNAAGFAEWKATWGGNGPQPIRGAGLRLTVASDERIYFVEKGTLYANSSLGLGDRLAPGKVGDVAFPSLGGKWFKAQRIRLWLTDRRLCLVGKDLDLAYPLASLASCRADVGGVVFALVDGSSRIRLAFTVHNPLIVSEIVRFLAKKPRLDPSP